MRSLCFCGKMFQNPRKVYNFQVDMEDSRKSSESESFSSSSSDSSDEEQLPAKKPFTTYHDPDQSASNVSPPLSITSSEGATVLRRSLRKIIEESKKDATSLSMTNSRESTPPQMSSSGRRISVWQMGSPASGSRSTRMSKNNNDDAGVRSRRGRVSTEVARAAKQLDFCRRRSTRVRRGKHGVIDDAAKSVPSGTAASSDDDASSVKDSNKLCNTGSDQNPIATSSCLASLMDTSDTDSRASSLYAYSTRSSGQVSAVKLNSCTRPTAKQKADKRSQLFKHVSERLSKLQSSDSETDGRTSSLRASFFDSFPDNSSNGSSVCSSVPASEPSADRNVDNCKTDVNSTSETQDASSVTPEGDEHRLENIAELDRNENCNGSQLKAASPQSVPGNDVPGDVPEIQSHLENKLTCFQNENGAVDNSGDSASDSLTGKDQLSGKNSSSALPAAEEHVAETQQEEKDSSLETNLDNSQTAKEEMKMKDTSDETLVMDQLEDDETKSDGCSKLMTCNDNEDHDNKERDSNVATKEEIDDMLNVKEEPPEILVSHDTFTVVIQLIINITGVIFVNLVSLRYI